MDGVIRGEISLGAIDTIAVPRFERAPLEADWQDSLERAWAFMPYDPMTAGHRVEQLRRELQRSGSSDVMPYVDWLRDRCRTAKQR